MREVRLDGTAGALVIGTALGTDYVLLPGGGAGGELRLPAAVIGTMPQGWCRLSPSG